MSVSHPVDLRVSGITPDAKGSLRDELLQHLASYSSLAGYSKQIVRLEASASNFTPLQWLSWQHHPVQIYWSNRHLDFEAAGIGIADAIDSYAIENHGYALARIQRYFSEYSGNARYYGGMRFNLKARIDEPWLPYGRVLFILPLFEVLRDLQGIRLACNVVMESGQSYGKKLHDTLQELEKINMRGPEDMEQESAALLFRQDIPEKEAWCRGIDSALSLFYAGNADKIVLGRSTFLHFQSAPKWFFLLKKLRQIEPTAYHFCIQPREDSVFIGATPERLYRRKGKIIYSEAVAGTRPRGSTDEEDRRLGRNLLQSEKDYREHIFVRNVIQSVLDKYCQYFNASDEIRLLQQSKVQHLYSRFHGKLKETVSDVDLLNSLHPTPAVGGVPREKALHTIEQLEPFDRGWHAGPVGWIGKDEAEFAVAIRSGLLNGKSLRLFAGAGLVKGSLAQSEWDEMETKISIFMNALGIR